MRPAILVFFVAVLVVSGTVFYRAQREEPPAQPTTEELLDALLPLTIETKSGIADLFVEVADDAPERSRGLQHRTQLSTRSGMLFVFDAENVKSFWMKNTLIPLDILWIDRKKTIVGHDTMVPCQPEHEDDPCPITSSPPETLYALEVHDHFVEEHGIEIGDRLTFVIE